MRRLLPGLLLACWLVGCGGATRIGAHRLDPAALPYLGVSCSVGNVITCDRVGVGVTLNQPAVRVTVQVAGRTVALRPPSDDRSNLWLGYLEDAGLRHGPLAVRAVRNHWYGEPLVTPYVVLKVFFADGTIARLAGPDQLHAGFG